MKPAWADEIFSIHETVVEKAITPWSPEDSRFIALALCGEVGELANMLKKHWRGDIGVLSPWMDPEVHNEMADIRVYLELLAHALGCDLDRQVELKLPAIRNKFLQTPLTGATK